MEFRRDRKSIEHKKNLDKLTESWGKSKFRPKPYVPPQAAERAKPWQHVKNDIIDDADEANHQTQLNMDSAKAKEFLKKREQNHRRNIIEAKRNEPTSWETFDDGQRKKREFVPLAIQHAKMNDVKDLTAEDRNFFRRKLTKAATNRNRIVDMAIKDMAKNGVMRGGVNKIKKEK